MKRIILLSCFLLTYSCNLDKSKECNLYDKPADISINTWILDNPKLKSILSDYIHVTDSSSKNSFIQIWYRVINDSTYSYTLMESADINAFIYSPPHIIFQFERKLVCCCIEGLDIFKINDDFLVEFMKKNYPEQYKYYLEAEDYPPPITGGGLEWELVFQNDSLISKDVYYTQ